MINKVAVRKGKKINFQLLAEPGSEVFVAGTFNNWDPRQHQLRDNPGSGHCKIMLALPLGRHEYKFVVNGEWRLDPTCPDWAPNDQGTLNSVIAV